MFLDASVVPCAGFLEANHAVIAEEFRELPLEEFESWVDRAAYVGDWRVFGLWHHARGHIFAEHLGSGRRLVRCPRTRQLVQRIPGLLAAGFSWLPPGCHILPHVDEQRVRSVRCHLGLVTHERARMRVRDETRAWETGRCFVFDSGDEHSAWNEGSEPRVAFIIEVALDAAMAPILPESRELERAVAAG